MLTWSFVDVSRELDGTARVPSRRPSLDQHVLGKSVVPRGAAHCCMPDSTTVCCTGRITTEKSTPGPESMSQNRSDFTIKTCCVRTVTGNNPLELLSSTLKILPVHYSFTVRVIFGGGLLELEANWNDIAKCDVTQWSPFIQFKLRYQWRTQDFILGIWI